MTDLREIVARRVKAQQRAHLVREIVETVLLTALIFAVVRITLQTYRIDPLSPSMEPSLIAGQLTLVNATAYWFGGPQRGEVIIFHHRHIPVDPTELKAGCTLESDSHGQLMTCDYVKRVIALAGDTVQVTATQVIVDGVVLREPYIQVPPGGAQSSQVLPPTTIGRNQYFVLGDNRLNSTDSRFFGSVARADIVGRVVLVFWPLNQAHWLPNYAAVFASVHA
ncbi:MAG TPA: signal peptidase I [Ktedonobacterales bacterium]|nr:signal peptidase I [Ktedonobacterales bacterium]